MKKSKLSTLLEKANEHYPDRMLSQYVDLKTGESIADDEGDTLALFIAREIVSVCEEGHTLAENACNVYNALDVAITELRRVRDAMNEMIH